MPDWSALWEEQKGNIRFWLFGIGLAALGSAATMLTDGLAWWQYFLLATIYVFMSIALAVSVWRLRKTSSPSPRTIRSWLDELGASTQVKDDPEYNFYYTVTFNLKVFIVAQPKTSPRHIDFYTHVTFTQADNARLENTQGGIDAVVRALRLFLAVMQVGHGGIFAPLARISLSRRLLVTEGFNEATFTDAFFGMESALNLVLVIVTQQEVAPPAPPILDAPAQA